MDRKRIWALLGVVCLFCSTGLFAQETSQVIPFTSVATNLPPGTTQDVSAQLWDAATGGTLLFSEAQPGLAVDNSGFINFVFGSLTSGGLDPANFPSGSSRFLDVVDATSASVLAARLPLNATAFALSPGPQGPPGERGPQGDPGPPGPPVNITSPDGSLVFGGTITDRTGVIAPSGVTTPKIADSAVATAKIADGAVTGAKIASGTVTGANIAVPLTLSGSTIGQSAILQATNSGTSGIGLTGISTAIGVSGSSSSSFGVGVSGASSGSNGFGVNGNAPSGTGVSGSGSTGVRGFGATGVSGTSSANSGVGVIGNATGTGGTGVIGTGPGVGVRGESTSGSGVVGSTSASLGAGVSGTNGGSGIGVLGNSPNGVAVRGDSTSGIGVIGSTMSFEAVRAFGGTGLAGHFFGNVTVTGTLTKGSGSFQIDHPLDPANKYLSHSFVESPDMMNIYNGIVVLDLHGQAWVHLPEWFEALNRDFRYQLTAIGAPAPRLYIATEISGNRFKIAGGKPSGRVSWQVTGIRQDAYANAHRIQVEEDKPAAERGYYLHPELFSAPQEKGSEWARHPELMGRLKEASTNQRAPAPQR